MMIIWQRYITTDTELKTKTTKHPHHNTGRRRKHANWGICLIENRSLCHLASRVQNDMDHMTVILYLMRELHYPNVYYINVCPKTVRSQWA